MTAQAQKRKPPTSEQIIAQQKTDAERQRSQQLALKPGAPLSAVPDSRTPVERYVDDIAPSMIAGRLIKFTKERTNSSSPKLAKSSAPTTTTRRCVTKP